MVRKNNATSVKKELEKLNKEIDKHMPLSNLNSSLELFEQNESQSSAQLNFDTLSLLQDIRDEMSLLRKNIFTDAESLISRKVQKDQEDFFNKVQESLFKLSSKMLQSKDHNYYSLRNENVELLKIVKKIQDDQEILHQKLDSISKLVIDKTMDQDKELRGVQDNLLSIANKVESNNFIVQEEIRKSQELAQLSHSNQSLGYEASESSTVVDIESKATPHIESRIARIDRILGDLNSPQE